MGKWLDLALSYHQAEAPDFSFPQDKRDKRDKRFPDSRDPQFSAVSAQNLLSRTKTTKGDNRSKSADFTTDSRPSDRFEGVPNEWIEGFQRLVAMPVPPDLEVARWLEVRADAERFLDQWGARASALNWDELSLFGVGKDAPEHRIDLAGLVWLLKGKTVVVMTEQFAVVDMGRGVRQSFPRQARAGQVPVWELPTPQKRTFQQEATSHE